MLKITITAVPHLTSQQHNQANALIQQVQEHDQSHRDPYLSNQFNVFSDMPAFFLASDHHELVGLLTLYADEDPSGSVDVTLNVLPKWRRQGVAFQLWQAAKKTLSWYGYHQVEFLTEQGFLDQAPKLLTNMQLQLDPVHEFQMIAPAHHVFKPDANRHEKRSMAEIKLRAKNKPTWQDQIRQAVDHTMRNHLIRDFKAFQKDLK